MMYQEAEITFAAFVNMWVDLSCNKSEFCLNPKSACYGPSYGALVQHKLRWMGGLLQIGRTSNLPTKLNIHYFLCSLFPGNF